MTQLFWERYSYIAGMRTKLNDPSLKRQQRIDLVQQIWVSERATNPCLHVGCGLRPIPGAINIDPNPDRAPCPDFDYDVHDLPFEDGYFASVVSNHVLPAFQDIDRAFEEMLRVLKPGGHMSHVIPDWSVAPQRHDARFVWQWQHQGWHSPEAFGKYVAKFADRLEVVTLEHFEGTTFSFKFEGKRL